MLNGVQDFDIRLSVSSIRHAASVSVSIYGWAPNGSIVKLGRYELRPSSNSNVFAARLDSGNITDYYRSWIRWAQRKGVDTNTVFPPLIILGTVIETGKGVYGFVKSVTVSAEKIVQGYSADLSISYKPSKPAITWSEYNAILGAKSLSEFPRERIPRDSLSYWELEGYKTYYDKPLPLVAVYLHGPDLYTINDVDLSVGLMADASTDIKVTFSMSALEFKKDQTSVTPLGYEIPGPSFELGGTKTWLQVMLRADSTSNPVLGPDGGCYLTSIGPQCYRVVLNGKASIEWKSMKETTPYLVSIGLNGDIAVATYRLYTTLIDCSSGTCIVKPVATNTYMNTTMVRPVLVDNDGGAIYGWAELSPEPYSNSHSVAWPAVHSIFMYWDHVDYGWLDKAFMESSYSYMKKISTISILSAGVSLPINSIIDSNLIGVGVSLTKQGETMSAVSMIVGLDTNQVGDSSCELWPWLYKSNVDYYLNGGYYPIGIMYADVYVYDTTACR
ncbi:hypothetical protein [Pyrofollis japonicus]|uniref:hypothetical protein n=1 Tax=Pyrofollis japonicus TaxID=3060460 RepID=UPI00295B6103|nr:hypothetical protein [Pyrofollis japonicus]